MRIYQKMKLTKDDIREIQRLFVDGTPIRELARCYSMDANTIRYHCSGVIGEPVRRLERAELLHLIYVKNPMEQYANVGGLHLEVKESPDTYPRLSRMTRMRFAQVLSQCLNELGWTRNGNSSRCYTFSKPEDPKPVMIEW